MQNMGRTCSALVVFMVIPLSYCGLVDAKIRASDKDLPVLLPNPPCDHRTW